MTRITLAAIAFAFCAAMSAQAGEVSPPSFGPSGCANSVFFSCRDARPQDQPGAVSQDQVAPSPKQEAPEARAAQPASIVTQGATPDQVAPSPKQEAPKARAAQPASIVTQGATPEHGEYQIGPMDELDISVFKVPELSQTVTVSDTGTVNLPLVGEVPAGGMTTQQMERSLASRLGAKYLQNPQVTVTVKNYNSQRVTISGEIKSPGVYPIKGKTSLLQLVAMAGGFQENSNSTVLVLRQSGGKRSATKFDVSQIEKGRREDPILQPGDTLVAGTSTIKKGFNTLLKGLPIAGAASSAATPAQ